jgi:hypothetical protein
MCRNVCRSSYRGSITYFCLSHWLITDVNYGLVLDHMAVGNVVDGLDLHAASIFRAKVYGLVSFCVFIAFCSEYKRRRG